MNTFQEPKIYEIIKQSRTAVYVRFLDLIGDSKENREVLSQTLDGLFFVGPIGILQAFALLQRKASLKLPRLAKVSLRIEEKNSLDKIVQLKTTILNDKESLELIVEILKLYMHCGMFSKVIGKIPDPYADPGIYMGVQPTIPLGELQKREINNFLEKYASEFPKKPDLERVTTLASNYWTKYIEVSIKAKRIVRPRRVN